MHSYLLSFDDSLNYSDTSHPADIVPHELSGNPDVVEVNLTSLENWYREYEEKRKSSVLDKSMEKDTVKLPITALKLLSSKLKLAYNSLDLVKGYTKASVIAFVLMTCSEMDLETEWDKIIPFGPFLDRAWLLPMHLMIDQNAASQSFTNLKLSYRGSERQSPSVLSLALQLSHIMTFKAESGLHQKDFNTETRLRLVVDELHSQDGFLAKWQVDGDKFKAILNLLVGTSLESRAVWFLKNHVHTFLNNVRRVKMSSRNRMRSTPAEWEKAVDYTCVMYEIYQLAKEFHAADEVAMNKCLDTLDYFAEVITAVEVCLPNWTVKHLTVWSELVDTKVSVHPEITDVDLEAAEEATQAAVYQETRSKLLDEAAWVRYKNQLNQKKAREHIVAVTHDKTIVDKLQQYKLELRDLWVSLDTSQLHGNADRPEHFQAWICAPDFMLPPRGTSHRAPKMSSEDAKDMKAAEINDFTSCDLWKLQGFSKDKVPMAVPESSFHVPMARSFLQSNETRKNLTDSQELSQWLSGESFWTAVLEGSLAILAFIIEYTQG
eukprot:s1878_g3.t1